MCVCVSGWARACACVHVSTGPPVSSTPPWTWSSRSASCPVLCSPLSDLLRGFSVLLLLKLWNSVDKMFSFLPSHTSNPPPHPHPHWSPPPEDTCPVPSPPHSLFLREAPSFSCSLPPPLESALPCRPLLSSLQVPVSYYSMPWLPHWFSGITDPPSPPLQLGMELEAFYNLTFLPLAGAFLDMVPAQRPSSYKWPSCVGD